MTIAKSQKTIEDFQDNAFYSAQKYNKSKEDSFNKFNNINFNKTKSIISFINEKKISNKSY